MRRAERGGVLGTLAQLAVVACATRVGVMLMLGLSMRSRPLWFLGACLVALACDQGTPAPGADGAMPPGDDGGTLTTDAGGGSSGAFECCIDDVGYRCSSEAALNQCAGFDPRCFERCTTPDCFDECSRMAEEATPDPSACTADATVTCESTGTCVRGSACDLDSDCASDNCTDGYCYDNSVGCACDLDSDCDSDNCTAGTCRGNGEGEACDLDSDCESDNCTDGRCEGRDFGSPCDLDSDCDSGSCTDGRCS